MDLRSLFKNSYSPNTYAPGDIIFNKDEEGHEMYVILEGQVDIGYGNTVFDTLDAGEIFGEMALVDNSTRSASAVAKTACELGVIDEERFFFMVQETPFFALSVMRIIADRLRKMDQASTK